MTSKATVRRYVMPEARDCSGRAKTEPYDFHAILHPNGSVRCAMCGSLILECLEGSACFTCRKCGARNAIDTGKPA